MELYGAFVSTALVFVICELCLVCCDITDGNAEHLKREHSLMKPYQGNVANWLANVVSVSSLTVEVA